MGPIREEKKKRREKKFGKEKVAPPKDLLRSNAFLYKLDEEQVAVSVEMWERLDSSCQGVVPRDKIVAMCESFEGEETSAEELLKHLGWDAYDNVNKNEWMRFIRRTKQIEGEEGMDKVPSLYHYLPHSMRGILGMQHTAGPCTLSITGGA